MSRKRQRIRKDAYNIFIATESSTADRSTEYYDLAVSYQVPESYVASAFRPARPDIE